VLNEIAEAANLAIHVEEKLIPVREDVRAACEILGLDPLQVACEGRFAAFVPEREAKRALEIMRAHPSGTGACRIGRVTDQRSPRVLLKSAIGARHVERRAAPAHLLSPRTAVVIRKPQIDTGAHRVVRVVAGIGLQPKKVKQGLPADHIVMAEIIKVTYDPAEGTPEDCLLHWRYPACKEPILQRLPAALEGDSPFAKVIATVRKKALTPEELKEGFDPAELIGSEAPVFATTRPGPGGKLVPAIGQVFDLATLHANVAALEVQPAVELGQGSSEAATSE
jgi:hypothetical protein